MTDLAAAALALCAALTAIQGYAMRRWYGPLTPGTIRWKADAAHRAARAHHRQAIAHLTDDDRAWLTAHGWRP